jgi:hypothetical protein
VVRGHGHARRDHVHEDAAHVDLVVHARAVLQRVARPLHELALAREAVDARAEREVQLLVGVVVLPGLQADEQETQDEREREEELEDATVARLDRMVRDGDRLLIMTRDNEVLSFSLKN